MMDRPRVLVRTRDLFFRASVEAGVARAGGVPVASGDCEGAVLESAVTASEEVEHLVASGTEVLVFAPHVESETLRAFRASGAKAVPNSQLEGAVADLLRYLVTESEESDTEHDP